MGFGNLSKYLKEEEGFFKSNSCKRGKWSNEMCGEICPKMDFHPTALGTGE